MTHISIQRLMGVCALALASLLSACGGASSTVDPLVPNRIIAFGDAFSAVDANGGGVYTVQTNETDNTVAGRIAARHGLVLRPAPYVSGTTFQTIGAAQSVSYAKNLQRVADVKNQIDDFLNLSSNNQIATKDLFIITVGNMDVYDAARGVGAGVSNAAQQLVDSINALHLRGAKHIVILGATNVARTPWARAYVANHPSVTLRSIQDLSWQSTAGVPSFNTELSVKLSDNFKYTPTPWPILFNTQYVSTFNNFAGTNLDGSAIVRTTQIINPDVAVCLQPEQMVGCATGAGLNSAYSDTAAAVSYANSAFADNFNLTPIANRLLADVILVQMRTMGWAP